MTFQEMQSKLNITRGRLITCIAKLQIAPAYVLPIVNKRPTVDYTPKQFAKIKELHEQIEKRQ